MGWNGSDGKKVENAKSSTSTINFNYKALSAGLIVVILAGVAIMLIMRGGSSESTKLKTRVAKPTTPIAIRKHSQRSQETERDSKIKKEINEKAANFITTRMTNIVEILGEKPLDPDDPDNALRTSIAKDVATILAIQPGEAIPDILVFSFMFEDDARAVAEAEGREYSGDGGNKDFLESLKKWRVSIKETDADSLAATKENLVKSQLELLDGMKEGLTVNDSIRAAYEYRVKAAEYRHELIDMLKDIHAKENDVLATRELLAEANKILNEKGLMKIDEESVLSVEEIFNDSQNTGFRTTDEEITQ